MSIDKWVSKGKSKEKKDKLDQKFNSLPEEKVQDLKKKKIRELTKTSKDNLVENLESNDFLNEIIEFKDWLNQRTYLKGDLEKIEIWIKNLSRKLYLEKQELSTKKEELIKQYRLIPPQFLDEKTRVAINKIINNKKRTNSDNYYLKKLKLIIHDKLSEASYYKTLKYIVEFKDKKIH